MSAYISWCLDKMDKVEIYAMSIAAVLDKPVDDLLPLFTRDRQAEILKFRFNADRNRTAYGELLVRHLLSERTGMAMENISFVRDKLGKPFCRQSEFQFNISHSGKWVVCSIGKVLNGVDVETSQEIDMAIAKEHFLLNEYNHLQMMPDEERNAALLKLWTVKESYLKYTGEGLSGGLACVDCLALLQGGDKVAAKNFVLPDEAVIGICTLKELLPNKIEFLAPITFLK